MYRSFASTSVSHLKAVYAKGEETCGWLIPTKGYPLKADAAWVGSRTGKRTPEKAIQQGQPS